MDRKALLGLLSGVTLVIAMLIGVGLANTRQAEGAPQPTRNAARDCAPGARGADAGYALPGACTRTE